MATWTTPNNVLYACSNSTTLQTVPSIYHAYQTPNLPVGTCMLLLDASSWEMQLQTCARRQVSWDTILYNTNYSYQANEDTCPYDAGVDEQMVIECTEQYSVEGVWTYKWTSKQQHADILDILNLKKQCLESSEHTHKLHTQLTHFHWNDTKQY